VCGDVSVFVDEVDLAGEATHDTTRLAFLCVSLDIHTMTLDIVCDMAGVLPMHGENILPLLAGFCLVVVKEKAFWFHGSLNIPFFAYGVNLYLNKNSLFISGSV
jgi:hypothetical protein